MSTIIETNRILLRKFEIDDFEDLFTIGSNKAINKYTGEEALKTEQEAKDIINNVTLLDYRKHGYGRWATIYKPDNKLIGFAGLKYLDEVGETDIGFRFLPEYWGQGIGTEIATDILRYGFKQLKLNKIIAIADPKNIGSCKVITNIGMKFYKTDGYQGGDHQYNWYIIKNPNSP